MDSPTVQPVIAALNSPFKKWPECQKVLRKLPRSVAKPDRQNILERISGSPQKIEIAFEVLCLLRDEKFVSRFEWLEAPMICILGGGDQDPDLETKTVPSEAKAWVFREFGEVRNMSEWNRFVASGRHLWVLNAILKAASKKQILVEALTALAECAEHCQNTNAEGKPKKIAISAADAKWIAKVIKAKIPVKLDLPKAFIESLFAINATADLSETLRRESNGLHFRLKQTVEDLEIEKKAKAAAEERANALRSDLATTRASLDEMRKELEEERLHNTRQGGFNEVSRNETINEVMSAVRRAVIHRLQNIRGYADRENPNREEIVALVGEIENHLNKIEEVLRK